MSPRNELLRVAIEASPAGMAVVDRMGTIVLANARWAAIFGYAPDELVGTTIETLVPERYRERHAALLQSFSAETVARPMGAGRDLCGRRKDGSQVHVDVGLNPARIGTAAYVLASVVDVTARQRLESAMPFLKVEVARVFFDSPLGIAIVDADLRFVFVNATVERMLGKPATALVGKTLTEQTHSDDAAACLARVEDLVHGRAQTARCTARWLRPDGTIRHVELAANALRDETGAIHVLLQLEDVTERVVAEATMQRLRAEVERQAEIHRTMLRHLPRGAIALIDRDLRFLSAAGPSIFEQTGKRPEVLVGHRVAEVIPAPYLEESLGAIERTLAGESLAWEAPRGARIYDFRTSPIFTGQAEPVAALVQLNDVTEQRAAEREVTERERWLETTLASIGEAIVATDASGRVTFMNHVAATLTGVELGTVTGRHVDEVLRFVDEAGAPVENPLARAIRLGGRVTANETRLDVRGVKVVVNVVATATFTESGAWRGGAVVLRDVTEQRTLERRVARAERVASVGTMAAGIAHEVNNPLAAIVGNVAFARDRLEKLRAAHVPDAMQHELDECLAALKDASAGADRVRKVVQTMRAFASKNPSGRRVVDLAALVESVVALAENTLRHKARVVRAYGDVPPVDADEAQLSQVVVNLLGNAADAIADGHADDNEIRIVTRTDEGGRAIVEVHDTGSGIPKEVQSRIFDPFFSTKGSGGGMGMGLALSHQFVTAAGGELEVESVPGATTFRILLPAARGPVATAPPPSEGLARAATGRLRVLVIDDDASVANMVRRVLEGHDVTVELDGRVAVDRIAAGERFDAVLCDLMMPTLSGMQVHDAIVVLDAAQAGRMIFITGGAVSGEATEFLARTKATIVHKPFAPAELRRILVEVASAGREG